MLDLSKLPQQPGKTYRTPIIYYFAGRWRSKEGVLKQYEAQRRWKKRKYAEDPKSHNEKRRLYEASLPIEKRAATRMRKKRLENIEEARKKEREAKYLERLRRREELNAKQRERYHKLPKEERAERKRASSERNIPHYGIASALRAVKRGDMSIHEFDKFIGERIALADSISSKIGRNE